MANEKDPKAPDPTPAVPIIAGGPGGEPEPAAPKLVKVKHGGKDLDLPEDAATAWQEREREYERKMSQQGAELGELRTWRKTVEQQIAPKKEPAEPDLNTLWFENPQAAYQKIKQEIRQEITGDYRRDQALRSFWDGFDRENPDLRDDRWVAEATFTEHLDTLADMTPAKAREELADLTRKKILKLTRKVKPTDTDTNPRTLLEPASGDRPPRPARDEDEGPKSMTELIAARRAARRAGAKGA